MSLKAYEDACLRAELFGEPKPNKDEFLSKNSHLDKVEFEEIDIIPCEHSAMLNEDLRAAGGGLSELNTILNSTQSKLNRLKGVCGSITNFFRVKLTAKDNLSYSSEPSYIGQTNYDKDSLQLTSNTGNTTALGKNEKANLQSAVNNQDGANLNSALSDLKTMQDVENTPLVSKASAKDMKHQIDSQVSKLDSLISKADRAQSSLQHQNKQMRAFLK